MSAPPAAQPWTARPLRDLLDVIASGSAPVGGGSSAALAAAVAAALVERCAKEAGDEESASRAAAARGTLSALIEIDAAVLATLVQGHAQRADNETMALLAEAASAPMTRLRGLAVELVALAERLERAGRPSLRGEAQCARLLAAAAARAAEAVRAMNARQIVPDPVPARKGSSIRAVDLADAGDETGPRWGMQSDELNATLLAWPAGHEIAEHVNDELDVLMVVLQGSACVAVDGVAHEVASDQLLLIPRSCARSITVGPRGVRYLSAHRRRDPLVPTPRAIA